MKNNGFNETDYSLRNKYHYKKELACELTDAATKIAQLFMDYFKCITGEVRVKNTKLTRFIITRGLDTIVNVFNYILLYSNNLDLAYFHCQKAFYFYAEFVGQISGDEKMFLQLSSRDASTYVYKKTIFEITPEIKQLHEPMTDATRVLLKSIAVYIDLYKTLLLKTINTDFTNIDKIDVLYTTVTTLTNPSALVQFHKTVEQLYYLIDDCDCFYDVSMAVVKKLTKRPETVFDKVTTDEFDAKVRGPRDKFIKWFVT